MTWFWRLREIFDGQKTKGDRLPLENMLEGLISQVNHKEYDKEKRIDRYKHKDRHKHKDRDKTQTQRQRQTQIQMK